MKNRPAALAFILVTLLIDVMGLGLIIPVFPNLLKQLSGSEVAGAQMLGIFTAIYAVMQFIFAPILGALSDRYGRRPVLLLSLLGVGLDYLFMYFAPNLGWLLLGRIIAGITGASITVANAYVADVTAPEDRARNFGLLGATFGVGFILGPALGGLLGNIDLRLPFAFAAGLSLLNAAYGYFVLPESVTDELRGRKLGREVFNPLAPLRDLGRYPLVRNLAGSFVLIGLAQQVIFSTWVLFTERTLGWSPAQNGIALAVVGVLSAITQAGLVGPAMRVLGERGAIFTGLLLGTVQYVLLGAARSGPVLYGSIVFGSLAGISGPAIQGLISRTVDDREQGRIQGALTSLNSLVGIFGPLAATWVFAYFNGGSSLDVPGAAFYMAALFSLAGAVLAGVVLRRMPKSMRTGVNEAEQSP
ncbi:tetracycline resistance MFS efflux pump [Deinococcus aquiradiocola]|uniref:Tetracycline resistance MFS efflux pump n=1 Tax=Deinococcus aquiradiocola TaxID=393059 RepID=A0A917PFN9_9DEIO|nr:TCR/Tet family MFS transporter [Deinococcus aquiradiocola]GGJ75414.1 tetracycline resistance MFS efflux pump [Deinococcus aquiradiocola]